MELEHGEEATSESNSDLQVEDDESDGNTSFLRAARDGNLQEVLEYLQGSTDINTSNPNGLNALHLASKEGHLNVVTELLKRGASVEASTKKGNTALHIASLAGHEKIVCLLVESGAKVNVQAHMGFTPLYMAAQEGHADVVKYLLANGASQSLSTKDGFTPLAVALQQGHERVVSVLLESDTKGKVKLPALHIAAKKDDIKSAALLLQNEQNNVDTQTKSGGLVNDTTKSGFTPLHIAAHYGNTNVGSLLIQRGADVNFKAKNNITPLHVSSRWGKPTMVTLLIDNKAIIDERTRDGLTPLHCAARSGHENVVDLLLERGAPKSAKTKNGLTPLHMAAQGDHVDCARLLLYHRAPVDDVTVDYLTPLHVAAHCGNVKTAKLLLDRKCDPNARALNGFTPLHIACKKNRIKVVELLLKYGASIEATTESGLTPLHVASFMGHMNIVIYLIQNNANPDFTTVRGETALHLAARASQTDIIRILLRNGASVDARAREQQTPLHIAARLGNTDNVTLLLQHNASPDAVTKDLYTPLHIAAKEGHEEVASVLLDHGSSHGLTTKKGFTPLHIAAKYGNMKVASLLLQKDANPDVQGKNGLTPLHVATHYNHVNVALLLLDHKASPHSTAKNGYTSLHIAAKKNQMDIATTLLEFGAKPDAESKNGFTPIHLAAQEGHTDMVSLLLEHKADVNCKAQNGLTPLHLSAQEDKVTVAEVLVKYLTQIDPQTKAGYTPLHTACHFGQINMVRFLLEQGASVSATTKLGYTPLHQAAQQGHVQVVSLLLKNKASPNAVTNNGQTPLSIAQRLGYISVVDTLTPVTEVAETIPASEDKLKIASPEIMQETLISDSEDEGGEDSISLERGESTSPLDTSYEKEFLFRHPGMSEDHRRRITSELGTVMRYPSYLERGPDYEAEMRYFSGDTLTSPHGRDKSKTDSVFGGDFSTLDRLDTGSVHSESKMRSVDEHSSEIDYGDDFDDSMKKRSAQLQYGEDFYLRQSVRYGRDPKRPVYPSSGYKSSLSYAESLSVDGIDLNDEFKYIQDDSVPRLPEQDYMEAQIMTASYAAYTSASPPDSRLAPTSSADKPRVSSYSGSSFSTSFDPDNVAIDQTPAFSGFLISFMVDARGGAMRGRRHSGVRIIIPPRKASMPTRVTCRLIKKEKLIHPIPLNEGEALAARVIEMGPVGTKFLGRIVIEIPHFASLRGKEREIKILRSNNGEKWEEHPIAATDEAVQKALHESIEDLEHEDDLSGRRITRILTDDFPRYFAIVTKIREEKQSVGESGGVISSTVVPQVQAVFPDGALTKKIRVGLQAQPISPDLVSKLLGNRVAVSPIVTVEPRRRKFHKNITLTIPIPKAAQKGMINQYEGDAPNLRVLYSISEGTELAVWDDLTDQTDLKFTEDCVSFTTRVSGRFWLMDCQNIADATTYATELYKEAIIVPYMARFVVFAKRTGEEEGKLRMFCMTDDRIDKTLEKQEHFVEVARSRDVEVLEGRPQFVEMAGNLIPITKSGDQLYISFKAFRENRLPCLVKIRDMDQDPAARVAFMKEPKVARGEVPQTPICNLNIALPDMSASSSMEMDGEAALELRKRSSLLREHGIVVEDTISRAKINLSDVADTLKGDWVILATQLDISNADIHQINSDYKTVNDQALAMLTLWKDKNGDEATGNALEKALIQINREDVVKKCMYNVETVQDEVEAAAARVAMDQSGFDTFTEEVGISKEDSMKRNMSLDVQFDEQDIQKESESVAEESLSGSEGQAPQAMEEDTAQFSMGDEPIMAEVDTRRPPAKEDVAKFEKQQEDFYDLIDQLDKYADIKDQQERMEKGEDIDDSHAVNEDEIFHTKHDRPKADDIISKVQDIGQFSAPQVQQTEDEEGAKTPPPSPVERQQFAEERREHAAAVDELAARLSVTEEAVEAVEQQPEETEQCQTMKTVEAIMEEHTIAPQESALSSSGAPEVYRTEDSKVTALENEPSMEEIVESLQEDLINAPQEERKGSISSSSSSSSSSDSESEGELSIEADDTSGQDQFIELKRKEPISSETMERNIADEGNIEDTGKIPEEIPYETADEGRKRKRTTSSSESDEERMDTASDDKIDKITESEPKQLDVEDEAVASSPDFERVAEAQPVVIEQKIPDVKITSSSSSSSTSSSDSEDDTSLKQGKEKPLMTSDSHQSEVIETKDTTTIQDEEQAVTVSEPESEESEPAIEEIEAEALKDVEKEIKGTSDVKLTEKRDDESSSSSSESDGEQQQEHHVAPPTPKTDKFEKFEIVEERNVETIKETKEKDEKEDKEEQMVPTKSTSSSSSSSSDGEDDDVQPISTTDTFKEERKDELVEKQPEFDVTKHEENVKLEPEELAQPSETKDSSSSSSESDEDNCPDEAPRTPKTDRFEEFEIVNKPTFEIKHEQPVESSVDGPAVKVVTPPIKETEFDVGAISKSDDYLEMDEDIQPVSDTEIERQVAKAPKPPMDVSSSSSSSSSSDEEEEPKQKSASSSSSEVNLPELQIREGSVERVEQFEVIEDKETTQKSDKTETLQTTEDMEVAVGIEEGKLEEMIVEEDDKELQGMPLHIPHAKDKKQQEVFDSELTGEDSFYEETLPDGTVVKHRKVTKFSVKPSECDECMELIEEEGPVKEKVEYEEEEEILPDGTIHTVSRVRRHSEKHVCQRMKSETGDERRLFEGDVNVPGSSAEDVIEVFEEPPKSVTEVEEVEETMDDGSTVKRKMIMNRMVHHVKTFHQSFDEEGNKEEEAYEIEEIIPGTETTFVEGESSSSSSSSSSSGEEVEEEEVNGELEVVTKSDGGVTETVQEWEDGGLVITKRTVERCVVKESDDAEGAESEDVQSHRLMMQKEIHTKTVLKDGQEQTFVHEEARVEQDSEPPEELRDSMQQIIDQFMETPAEPENQQLLEHDV